MRKIGALCTNLPQFLTLCESSVFLQATEESNATTILTLGGSEPDQVFCPLRKLFTVQSRPRRVSIQVSIKPGEVE